MDVYTLRNNAISNMVRGYVFAAGTTPDGQRFEIKVTFADPNRALGRGVRPEKPQLTTYYKVSVGGTEITTLSSVEQATALIRNNGWISE